MGMKELQDCSIMHNDLAARNIFVRWSGLFPEFRDRWKKNSASIMLRFEIESFFILLDQVGDFGQARVAKQTKNIVEWKPVRWAGTQLRIFT
jgi:hypothetical protein